MAWNRWQQTLRSACLCSPLQTSLDALNSASLLDFAMEPSTGFTNPAPAYESALQSPSYHRSECAKDSSNHTNQCSFPLSSRPCMLLVCLVNNAVGEHLHACLHACLLASLQAVLSIQGPTKLQSSLLAPILPASLKPGSFCAKVDHRALVAGKHAIGS